MTSYSIANVRISQPPMRNLLWRYDQGPEPRSGCHVKLKKGNASEYLVIGLGNISKRLLILEMGKYDQIKLVAPSECVTLDKPRLTLRELLEEVKQSALAGCEAPMQYLSAHWDGLNGDKYKNVRASLYAELAMMRTDGGFIKYRLNDFASRIATEFENEPELLPSEIRIEKSGRKIEITWGKGSPSEAMEMALEYGEEQLNADDIMEPYVETIPTRGQIWFNMHHQGGLVLSVTQRDDVLWVEMLDEEQNILTLPAADLYLASTGVQEEAIENIVNYCIDIKRGWILLRKANEAMSANPPDYYACALLAATAFKAECKRNPATAQKAWKLLLGASKCVTPEQKKKLVALAPEILQAGQKKPQAKGTPDACLAAWKQHAEVVTPEEAPSVEEAPIAATSPNMSAIAPAAHSPRAVRPINVRVSEQELCAMEWTLQPGANTHEEAVQTSLRWLGGRLGMTLPPQWGIGGREISQHGIRVEIEAIKNNFAFRMEHPDAAEPTRTWRLEVTILSGDKSSVAGLRLSVQDRKPLPVPELSMPGIVRYWSEAPGIIVAGMNAKDPWNINSTVEALHLRRILQDKSRDDVVWVFDSKGAPEIHHGAAGVAMVVTISQLQRVEYAKKFGTIEPDEAHYYLPGDPVPHRHVLSSDSLCKQLIKLSVKAKNFQPIPHFAGLREAHRTAQQKTHVKPVIFGQTATDELDSEHDELRADIEQHAQDLQVLLDIALEEKHLVEKESTALKKEIQNLRAKLFASRSAKQVETQTQDDVWIPDSLATIAQWAPEVFPKVVFADKAIKFASKCDDHEAPETIYAALRGLATHYWDMRFGDVEDGKKKWDEFLKEHRLQCGSTGAALNNSHYSDAYQA